MLDWFSSLFEEPIVFRPGVPMSVSITLQHQRRRKDIQVKSTDAVVRIMELAWKEFSVPVADQRLVYKGKSLSPDLRIEQLALITGAKMLVMGEPVLKSPDNHSKLFADLHRRYAELEAEFEATTDRQKVGGVGEVCCFLSGFPHAKHNNNKQNTTGMPAHVGEAGPDGHPAGGRRHSCRAEDLCEAPSATAGQGGCKIGGKPLATAPPPKKNTHPSSLPPLPSLSSSLPLIPPSLPPPPLFVGAPRK